MRQAGNFTSLFLLCGTMLGLWIWNGGQSSAFLLVGTGVWLGAALGSALLCMRDVSAESRVAISRLYAGDTIPVSLRIRHRSYWPVMWLVVKETWLHSGSGIRTEYRQLVFPWFRASFTLTYSLTGLRRGEYRSEGVELHTGDLFGLLQVRRSRKGQTTFLVYPKPLEIEDKLPSGADDEDTAGRQAFVWRESGVIRGVRPYEAGDPLQRIHWKLTARTGALKTKTFEPASSRRITVCLDVSASSYAEISGVAMFEAALRATAGITRQALAGGSGGVQLRSSANGDAGITVTSIDEIRMAYECLAKLRPEGRESYADYLLQEALRLPPRQTLVFVTPLSGSGVLLALRRLRNSGSACSVMLVHAAPTLSWPHRQWRRELQEMRCGFAEVQAAGESSASARVMGGAVDGIA